MRRALAVPLRLGPAMEGGRPERCATRYTNVVPHQSLGTAPMIDLGPSRCCGAPLYGYVVRGPVKGAVCFLTATGERRFHGYKPQERVDCGAAQIRQDLKSTSLNHRHSCTARSPM